MANTKQAIKMVRKIVKRTTHNNWWKSQVKNAKKEVEAAITSGNNQKESLAKLFKKVDKATKNSTIHKNKANRIKSKYQKLISKITSEKK